MSTPPDSSFLRTSRAPRRKFITGALALGATSFTHPLLSQEGDSGTLIGPTLGHGDKNSIMVWIRATQEGPFELEVSPEAGGEAQLFPATATLDNDLCIHWHATALKAGTAYRYRILRGNEVIADDPAQQFVTAPNDNTPAKVRFAISSCAKEDEGSRAVWNRMAAEEIEAVVLLGDTPYIDSTDLPIQTKRYREFAAVPEYQALLRSRPCWWTWDDHDFAGNDSSGLALGKENARLVFTRYRSQPTYGQDDEGIFHSFRHGPLEVFMIDTRWFSMTEPSFASPHRPTLLGKKQWEWLQESLLASTAPFKLLACGMIWDDKENSESDDWGSYRHERNARKVHWRASYSRRHSGGWRHSRESGPALQDRKDSRL